MNYLPQTTAELQMNPATLLATVSFNFPVRFFAQIIVIGPLWGDYSKPIHKSCATRLEIANEELYNMIAIERYLDYTTNSVPKGKVSHTNVLCAEFMYATLIRNPIERLVSHLRMIGTQEPYHTPADAAASNGGPRTPYITTTGSRISGSSARVLARWPEITNNFLIRCLLGPGVYSLPLHGVTRSHLHQAKRVLRQLAMVVPSEEIESGAVVIRGVLGWANIPKRYEGVFEGRVCMH
jgi:hypothetical protein